MGGGEGSTGIEILQAPLGHPDLEAVVISRILPKWMSRVRPFVPRSNGARIPGLGKAVASHRLETGRTHLATGEGCIMVMGDPRNRSGNGDGRGTVGAKAG